MQRCTVSCELQPLQVEETKCDDGFIEADRLTGADAGHDGGRRACNHAAAELRF